MHARVTVEPVPCLKDNYAYLVTCRTTGEIALVDASEVGPVKTALAGRRLGAIWSTHHHHDHVGANRSFAADGVPIHGHASDRGRIPGQTVFHDDADRFRFGALEVEVLHVPGHTLGAVAYVVGGAVFTGDTLFLGGCGRLFEGTAAMMYASLSRLASLPPETQVYCGHEYAASNLAFARHLEPSHVGIAARAARVAARGDGPSEGTIGDELATNPFLRTDSAELRSRLGVDGASVEVFAAARKAKDSFRG